LPHADVALGKSQRPKIGRSPSKPLRNDHAGGNTILPYSLHRRGAVSHPISN
jgi:hypothetical protein